MCIIVLAVCPVAGAQEIDIQAELEQLDAVVEKRQEYIAAKIHSINNYKANHLQYSDGMAQYSYCKHLHDEYLTFDTDSAIHYAMRAIEVSRAAGLENGADVGAIDLALVTIRKGDVARAQALLAQLGPIDEYQESLQSRVATAHLEFGLRNNMLQAAGYGNDLKGAKRRIWDAYSPYIPADNWVHAYYKSQVIDQGDEQELLRHVEATAQPSVQAAMLYSALAQSVLKTGDHDLYLHYLIQSAINDIMSANREASSLVTLLETPLIDKASRRAMEYSNACAENVRSYSDMGRSLKVVRINSVIAQAYQDRLEQNEIIQKAAIALLAVALVFIAVMLVLLIRKSRRQTAINLKLHDMSAELRERIDEGRAMQEELERSYGMLESEINQRNSNFLDVYLLVSNYINDMGAYKKAVYNMITAGRVDKARKELASTSINEKYLREFYSQFDKAFLRSHPDFLKRFNALMKPDSQIEPPEGSMTPELRIFALMSIGITDGTSIASFLQYSVQTIYNYRMRVRRSACVGEKEFDAAVECMYVPAVATTDAE